MNEIAKNNTIQIPGDLLQQQKSSTFIFLLPQRKLLYL